MGACQLEVQASKSFFSSKGEMIKYTWSNLRSAQAFINRYIILVACRQNLHDDPYLHKRAFLIKNIPVMKWQQKVCMSERILSITLGGYFRSFLRFRENIRKSIHLFFVKRTNMSYKMQTPNTVIPVSLLNIAALASNILPIIWPAYFQNGIPFLWWIHLK